jgi:hypothetical protein
VLTRTIEPTSEADSLRVVEETGAEPVSHLSLNRRLSTFAKSSFQQLLLIACARIGRYTTLNLTWYLPPWPA